MTRRFLGAALAAVCVSFFQVQGPLRVFLSRSGQAALAYADDRAQAARTNLFAEEAQRPIDLDLPAPLRRPAQPAAQFAQNAASTSAPAAPAAPPAPPIEAPQLAFQPTPAAQDIAPDAKLVPLKPRLSYQRVPLYDVLTGRSAPMLARVGARPGCRCGARAQTVGWSRDVGHFGPSWSQDYRFGLGLSASAQTPYVPGSNTGGCSEP